MNAAASNPLTVVTGQWLYSGTIPCAVRVIRSDYCPGTGDAEDEPEVAEDRAVECFILEFQTPVGFPEWIGGGIYTTFDGATNAAAIKLGQSLRWIT